MKTWTINPITRGATLNSTKITFPFDITGFTMEMQFRSSPKNENPSFSWLTSDDTLQKTSTNEITMKERVMNYPVGFYTCNLLMINQNGARKVPFKINITILI